MPIFPQFTHTMYNTLGVCTQKSSKPFYITNERYNVNMHVVHCYTSLLEMACYIELAFYLSLFYLTYYFGTQVRVIISVLVSNFILCSHTLYVDLCGCDYLMFDVAIFTACYLSILNLRANTYEP